MRLSVLVLLLLISNIVSSQKVDTVFLFQKPGQKVFVEPTKNIEQYKRLTDLELNDSFNFYKESIETFKQRGLKYHKINFGNFPKQWATIKFYKDSFYAYSYSDFYFDYKLAVTDSFFIDDSEGPHAEEILSFKKRNDSTFSFFISDYDSSKKPQKINFYIIDRKRNIAVVETIKDGDKNYLLMMDASKLIDLQIINNYTEEKEWEFDFDLPDYDKLTNGRIRFNSKQNLEAKSAAIEFFKWFYANEDSLNTYKIFYLAGKDSARNWKLNFNEIDKYINHLKRSKLISEKFCNTLMRKMKRIEKGYKENPNESYKLEEKNNGLIMEFRDIGFLPVNLGNLKIERCNTFAKSVYLSLGVSELNNIGISLTKVNGKWLVDWVNGITYSDQ